MHKKTAANQATPVRRIKATPRFETGSLLVDGNLDGPGFGNLFLR